MSPMLNETPVIERQAIRTTDDPGYRVRAFCLIDGYPGEVDILVNTRRQEYNRYEISVFDPVATMWSQVYRLHAEEVDHMPIIPEDPATLMHLQAIATTLHTIAQAVVITGNRRQDQIEAAEAVAKREALRNWAITENIVAMRADDTVTRVPADDVDAELAELAELTDAEDED